MDIAPRLSLTVNGKNVTARQIEILAAVQEEGSKTAAAKKLGISVPVVHRYIAGMEESTGEKMISSTPGGSVLTKSGIELTETSRMMNLRFKDERKTTVSCTPVTEELMMSLMSSLHSGADLIVSDDTVNIRMLRNGMTDMIILDDPVHLFDLGGFQWTDAGEMDMVHVDRGRSYVTYRYGAQRIAYMHLDAKGTEYTVDGEMMSLRDLMNSGRSFFVDEILLVREGIRIRSATEPSVLRHMISAVYRDGSNDEIRRILNGLAKNRMI